MKLPFNMATLLDASMAVGVTAVGGGIFEIDLETEAVWIREYLKVAGIMISLDTIDYILDCLATYIEEATPVSRVRIDCQEFINWMDRRLPSPLSIMEIEWINNVLAAESDYLMIAGLLK